MWAVYLYNPLPVNDLGRPAPPKPLVVKDLGGWRSYTVPISHIVEGVVAIVMVLIRVAYVVVVVLLILLASLLLHKGELLKLLPSSRCSQLSLTASVRPIDDALPAWIDGADLLLCGNLSLHLGAFIKFDIGHASGMGEPSERIIINGHIYKVQ